MQKNKLSQKNNPFTPLTLTALALVLSACSASAEDYRVETQEAYKSALKQAKPGDTIVLANGTWEDFEVLFKAEGKKGKPITLTAETKGEVILSGQSNLRLAGEYLEVSGLVFKDGYTPTKEVIAFRQNKQNLAFNSRVTEVVIDNYNQPERYEVDFWVMMYGQNNRFDHNHLVGKRNKGVTMAVRLDSASSQKNSHSIDHNYFGPRPILGSNGGESLRIGTSKYSLSDSLTVVENNYFDRCNGELEIISNKSGKNTFKNNTFFESRGTLTMRHGNNNLVEGNVFFGNGADHTGGIRVINAGQTIRNNYMQGLKGTRFGGALVVMNGVPNSSINRYHQVKDAVIENNSLIDSDNIQLAAGSDSERSATPVDSVFKHNLIANSEPRDVFTVYDDVTGISFADNVVLGNPVPDFTEGFRAEQSILVMHENGLKYPVDALDAGISKDLNVTAKDITGATWYPKAEPDIAFGSGETHEISPGETALSAAIKLSAPGDTISLAPGDYTVSRILKIDKPLTFTSKGKANLVFERTTLFEIVNGGSLRLDGLNISGAESPDNAGNSVIRTSPYSMLRNYRLEIANSNFTAIDVNHSFNVVTVSKGTFADHISIEKSSFEDVTGTVLKLDKESDDYGIYNSEYVTFTDSSFTNIGGALVDFYRGGTDESTFGPHFTLTDNVLDSVGNGKRNKSKASVHLHGVQVTDISKNLFKNSPAFLINHTVGEPQSKIYNNRFDGTPAPLVFELNSGLQPTAVISDNEGLTP